LTIADINFTIYVYLFKVNASFVTDNQILTLDEVAKVMHVSLKTVYRWIGSRQLRAAKIGRKTYRVMERDLIQFVNDNIK